MLIVFLGAEGSSRDLYSRYNSINVTNSGVSVHVTKTVVTLLSRVWGQNDTRCSVDGATGRVSPRHSSRRLKRQRREKV